MVGIPFKKEQIEAYENGATMFITKLDVDIQLDEKFKYDKEYYIKEIIDSYSPLQKGDKFFIQEEFAELLEDIDDINSEKIYYRADGEINDALDFDYEPLEVTWIDAEKMKGLESRYKSSACLNVELKRVQDIGHKEFKNLDTPFDVDRTIEIQEDDFAYEWFIDYIEEQFDIKYEDNPYVFLYTISGKEK